MDTITFHNIATKVSESSDINRYMKTIIAAAELLEAELDNHDNTIVTLHHLPTFTTPILNIWNSGFAERITHAINTTTRLFQPFGNP